MSPSGTDTKRDDCPTDRAPGTRRFRRVLTPRTDRGTQCHSSPATDARSERPFGPGGPPVRRCGRRHDGAGVGGPHRRPGQRRRRPGLRRRPDKGSLYNIAEVVGAHAAYRRRAHRQGRRRRADRHRRRPGRRTDQRQRGQRAGPVLRQPEAGTAHLDGFGHGTHLAVDHRRAGRRRHPGVLPRPEPLHRHRARRQPGQRQGRREQRRRRRQPGHRRHRLGRRSTARTRR